MKRNNDCVFTTTICSYCDADVGKWH